MGEAFYYSCTTPVLDICASLPDAKLAEHIYSDSTSQPRFPSFLDMDPTTSNVSLSRSQSHRNIDKYILPPISPLSTFSFGQTGRTASGHLTLSRQASFIQQPPRLVSRWSLSTRYSHGTLSSYAKSIFTRNSTTPEVPPLPEKMDHVLRPSTAPTTKRSSLGYPDVSYDAPRGILRRPGTAPEFTSPPPYSRDP